MNSIQKFHFREQRLMQMRKVYSFLSSVASNWRTCCFSFPLCWITTIVSQLVGKLTRVLSRNSAMLLLQVLIFVYHIYEHPCRHVFFFSGIEFYLVGCRKSNK